MANRLTTFTANTTILSADMNAEFNNIFIGDISRTAGYWGSDDNIPTHFGSSQDATLEWNTDQTQDALILGLGASKSFHIMDKGDMGTDWGVVASSSPTLFVHSSDETTTTSWISMRHDGTDGRINVGTGTIKLVGAVDVSSTITFNDVATFAADLEITDDGPVITVGAGSPESSKTADVGSIYMRTDGGSGTALYLKESGSADTGWTAVQVGAASFTGFTDGTVSAPGGYFASETGSGLYRTGADAVSFAMTGTQVLSMTSTAFDPQVAVDCGSTLDVTGNATFDADVNITRSNTATDPQLQLNQSSTGDAVLGFNTSGTDWSIGVDNSDNDALKIAPNLTNVGTTSYITLGTAATETGIRGDIHVAASLPSGTSDTTSLLNLYENNTQLTPILTVEQDSTGDAAIMCVLSGTQGWMMGVDNSDGDSFKITPTTTDLGNSDIFKIATDGGVLIGTGLTSQGSGTVNAEAYYDNDVTPVPDFVFMDGYELLSIDEMADFYREHHHLPWMPPAAEHDSMSISERSLRNLECVENLALYVEQLHRRIEELESR